MGNSPVKAFFYELCHNKTGLRRNVLLEIFLRKLGRFDTAQEVSVKLEQNMISFVDEQKIIHNYWQIDHMA